MPRPKGSKNAKKAVKQVVKEYFDEEPVQPEESKQPEEIAVKNIKAEDIYTEVKASPFEEQIRSVLSHILELLKASLIDAFKQYVNSRIAGSLPASVEEFINQFKHTTKVHGIADEVLLQSLDEVELEYLSASTKVKTVQPDAQVSLPQPVAKAPAQTAPAQTAPVEKKAVSVFDALDIL